MHVDPTHRYPQQSTPTVNELSTWAPWTRVAPGQAAEAQPHHARRKLSKLSAHPDLRRRDSTPTARRRRTAQTLSTTAAPRNLPSRCLAAHIFALSLSLTGIADAADDRVRGGTKQASGNHLRRVFDGRAKSVAARRFPDWCGEAAAGATSPALRRLRKWARSGGLGDRSLRRPACA